jgi:2,3-bisphosphoglycerate-independent phosphoglycerate mutase
LDPQALSDDAEKTAKLVQEFVDQARDILADHQPANMVLLRGFSKLPDWPLFEDTFGLHAAAIAAYPMYRGVAKLVGMDVLETGTQFEEEVSTLEKHWNDYDFFFLHMKPIDSAGEDGNYERKTQLIEQVDTLIPRLLELEPDVLLVTGDHSTPSLLKYHSWHPVPVMLWSKYCRPDEVKSFGERACMGGGLGPRIPAVDLMPLALANALRLDKFGA